jgi:hypothetical protein
MKLNLSAFFILLSIFFLFSCVSHPPDTIETMPVDIPDEELVEDQDDYSEEPVTIPEEVETPIEVPDVETKIDNDEIETATDSLEQEDTIFRVSAQEEGTYIWDGIEIARLKAGVPLEGKSLSSGTHSLEVEYSSGRREILELTINDNTVSRIDFLWQKPAYTIEELVDLFEHHDPDHSPITKIRKPSAAVKNAEPEVTPDLIAADIEVVELIGPEGRYLGEVQNNLSHGRGTFYWENGDVYRGNWVNGKKDGLGIYILTNGDYYEGFWRNDRFNGYGEYSWGNGEYYKGDWQNGIMHGGGTYAHLDGSEYRGDWQKGNRHGRGVFEETGGFTYTGDWQDNTKYGFGLLELATGEYYEGDFRDNKKHGFGRYYWNNGDRYEGEWSDDLIHGQGTFYWADGDYYSGSWRNGFMHGNGTYYWVSGDYYEGDYEFGRASGGYLYKVDGIKTWSFIDEDGNWVHNQ